MLKILLFGRLGDVAGDTELGIEWDESIATVETVREKILSSNPELTSALDEKRNLVAVNKQICDEDTPVEDGDEVAFVGNDCFRHGNGGRLAVLVPQVAYLQVGREHLTHLGGERRSGLVPQTEYICSLSCETASEGGHLAGIGRRDHQDVHAVLPRSRNGRRGS